jgi:ferredoxin
VPASVPATAEIRVELCVSCGECVSVCPVGAISLNAHGKAVVDRGLCRGCGACVQVCPVGAVRMSDSVGAGHHRELTDDQGSMRTKHT